MILFALLAYTSAYTPLDLERCRVLSRDAESGAMAWRCPGRGGIALYAAYDDDRYDLHAGGAGAWEGLGGFNHLGPRVEWRLRNGRPIAIIYRYIQSGPDQPPGTRLAVKTIGRPGHPGCLVSMIDGAWPNANDLARQRADTRAEAFRCGVDTPERGAE